MAGAPRRGALGGAANEAGAEHRAGVAALAVSYGLLGQRLPWLSSTAPPQRLHMEADVHVDDIVVDLTYDSRAFVQAKLSGTKAALLSTVGQWCASIASGECSPSDEVLLVVAQGTERLRNLAAALDSRRAGASLSPPAARALDGLRQMAARHGLSSSQIDHLLTAARIRFLDARDGGPRKISVPPCSTRLSSGQATAGRHFTLCAPALTSWPSSARLPRSRSGDSGS